jgi:uncharacterized RDD family membrane protein YckC
VFTLGIGWLIWFAIVAPKAQTPAKQLLNVRIHDYSSGDLASTGQVWMREVVGKLVVPMLIAVVGVVVTASEAGGNLYSIYTLGSAIAILATEQNRGFWDYLAGTSVRYHPTGQVEMPVDLSAKPRTDRRLQELELLRSRGVISDSEYQEKRSQIIADL